MLVADVKLRQVDGILLDSPITSKSMVILFWEPFIFFDTSCH